MAKIGAIDFESVEDRKDFTPIPPQDVIAALTESSYDPNKAGTGHALNLTFQVLEGDFKGRNLWALLNLDNPSADAVRIAQSELKQLVSAVGMTGKFGDDTDVLHNIPLVLTVEVEPPKYEQDGKTIKYKAKNKITKYVALDPATQAAVAAQPKAATAAPVAANAGATKAGLPPFLAAKQK